MKKSSCAVLRTTVGRPRIIKVPSGIICPPDLVLNMLLLIAHIAELEDDDAPPPTVFIQVEPYEEMHSNFRGDPQSRISGRCLPSQSASGQSLTSYRLLSLVSPLLAAISEAIDFSNASALTLYRLRRLFDMVVDLRPDASLNILEVVAYHTPKARFTALGLLYSYWPRALGHCLVSRPFESLADAHHPLPYRPHAHQFVLWQFAEHSSPMLFEGNILRECRSCFKQIVGLGLFCPLCICAVHFDCYDYPDGNLLTQYPVELGSSTQKVAVHRFCYVQLPRSEPNGHYVSGHTFSIVNMFTLALCFICKLPLWGCHSQGLKCDSCNHFVHAGCIPPLSATVVAWCPTAPLTLALMTISPLNLRNSFDNHFKGLLQLDSDSLRHCEDILIYSDILWTQLQLLSNGLALGSIIIEGGRDASEPFSLELQSLLDHFRATLLSPGCVPSDMLNDFFQECRSASRTTLLFDWSTLGFLAASIKLVDVTADTFTGGTPDPFLSPQLDHIRSRPHTYDAIPLGLLHNNLATNFQIHSDIAAEMLLSHLHHIGLFEIPEIRVVEPNGLLRYKESLCLFSLPLCLDLSVNVEMLMTAIEACLSDIYLSVNEAGFQLLVRRAWPTEMSTNYALHRLMKVVLGWILAEVRKFTFDFRVTSDSHLMEDEGLAVILRDYIPLGRELPGVRTSSMRQPWPSSERFATSSKNGGDYLTQRRSLLRSYATAWLLALHDLDPMFYGKTCFELVFEIAGERLEAEASEDMASNVRPLVDFHTEALKGGLDVATHHQTLPSFCRLHYI
jgi:hypothetical protein